MAADMRTPDLSGQAALVTGGSRGIGLSIAEALLAAGAGVVVTGRDQSHLDKARAHLTRASAGGRLEVLRADVRSAESAAAAVKLAVDRLGRLDILVNNAGIGVFRNVDAMDEASWHDVIETNLTGVFLLCHAAIPALRERGGWIINISSLAARNPFAGGAAYSASKAGLNAFSEALMHEVRHDGIRVSCVMPGSVATGFSGGTSPSGPADSWKLSPDDVAEAVIDLLAHPARSHPSRVELRPSRPPKR